MHRLLVQGGPSPVVRAPVALALVKLLRLLPSEVERTELPRALQGGSIQRTELPRALQWTCLCVQGIANLLADRQQRVRDDARHVLVAVAKELGPAYLPYICNVLRSMFRCFFARECMLWRSVLTEVVAEVVSVPPMTGHQENGGPSGLLQAA
eukprot:1161702-Pelagomonas_calceolata.AAC.11